jgi:hypothetical protein
VAAPQRPPQPNPRARRPQAPRPVPPQRGQARPVPPQGQPPFPAPRPVQPRGQYLQKPNPSNIQLQRAPVVGRPPFRPPQPGQPLPPRLTTQGTPPGQGQPPKRGKRGNKQKPRGRSQQEVDLRKQVIQSEIEIQKALIESEKAYREGLSTIRDLISPPSVTINTGYLEMGTKLSRSFFVLTYPRVISSGWLEGLVNADLAMDLSIFIFPRDSSQVLRELKKKTGRIQANLQLNQEKGAARDPALETAYQDVESLRDAIQQGVEKFFRVGVYITIYADNLEQLEKLSQAVEGLLSQQNIISKRAALQMDDGFNAGLPILKDDLEVYTNMNTSPLSASFPFVSSELSSDSGILYGINRHNSSLIIFDRFEMENANQVVFATSGAGKSYAVKLENSPKSHDRSKCDCN